MANVYLVRDLFLNMHLIIFLQFYWFIQDYRFLVTFDVFGGS